MYISDKGVLRMYLCQINNGKYVVLSYRSDVTLLGSGLF